MRLAGLCSILPTRLGDRSESVRRSVLGRPTDERSDTTTERGGSISCGATLGSLGATAPESEDSHDLKMLDSDDGGVGVGVGGGVLAASVVPR